MIPDEEIFEAAAALPAADRPAFLDGACAGDPEGRQRLDALLRSHDVSGFMDGAAFADGAGPDIEWESPPAEQSGQQIGRYRLIERIGEGGFGVVWEAEQLEPVRRRVAIKVIKAGMDSNEVIRRFEAERQALAMMDHANIAKVFDAGTTGKGRPYFVMELVRGVRITEFCDGNKQPTEGRLRLFITVCQAVQHAHQKGIIHRDLKPSNILVAPGDDGTPVPKVIDFGVAKATQGRLTDGTLFTQFDQFIGTPAYMSPEQTAMSGLDVDTRSDIYSLGILLYELLTGKPPFDTKSLLSAGHEEMRRVIREVEPPKPSTRLKELLTAATAAADQRNPDSSILNPKASIEPDLDWIVMKAIEKDRTRRYETANDLALDIQRFLSNEPVSATPPSAGYRFHKFARRNRMALRVAVLLIFATTLSTWQAIRASRGQTVANAATEQLREKLREAAQSDRVIANDLAGQGRYREAIIRLARACEYAPESSMAAEQAMILANSASLHATAAVLAGHEAAVNRAAFDRKGGRLVTASGDQTARVWDAATGALITKLSGHRGVVRSAHFSPDGARIVTAAEDNTACLWDAATGRLLVTLSGHTGYLNDAQFSPDGTRIVTASWDKTARVWDAMTGGLVFTLSGHGESIKDAQFSPDGSRIVTASNDRNARVWDAATGELIFTLSGNEGQVNTGQFSPDGARIVTASWDNAARVWDAATGQLLMTLPGHQHRIRNAEFSPSGSHIVTSSDDNTARVWNAATGRLIHALSSHLERVWSAHFSPDGRRIVTASDDATAKVWDTGSGRLISTLTGHRAAVVAARFSPDGARLVTSSDDGTARVWDMVSIRPVPILSGHGHRVWNGHFSADGSRILTNSDDRTARVWDAATGCPIATLAGHQDSVWTAEFSPDGTRVLTASADATARIWNAATGDSITTLSGHRGGISRARFSRDGTRVVTASFDGTARVWEAGTGKVMATLTGHESFVWNACFSPDGTRIVTGSDDKSGRVWNAITGQHVGTLSGFERHVWGIDFSPDGARVATASYDGSVRVWDVATGHPLVAFSGHQNSIVRSAQFSPDGALIVTAADDKSARLFDSVTGQPTAAPLLHQDSLRSAQFSPDGARVLTASWEGARVWNAATAQLVAILSEHRESVQQTQRSLDAARIERAAADRASDQKAARPDPVPDGPPDIFSNHTGRINSAEFSPDGARVVTASDDQTARVWELLGTRQPPPAWFPNLLRVVVSGTLNADGQIEELTAAEWVRLRAEVLDATKSDTTRYGEIARYYLTPGPDRPARPEAKITSRDAALSLISPNATRLQLERAYALDPAHPLVHIALARFADDKAEAEFLRRYGLGRIPPAAAVETLQRAAALLAVQSGQEARELELIGRVESAAGGVALAQARQRKMILLTVLGRFQEARGVEAALAASAPELRRAALPEAALIASRAGRAEEATTWIEEAIRLAPGDERVHRLGGWCCLILGEDEKALQHFTNQSPGDGGDGSASDAAREIDRKLGLAMALTAAGRTRDALDIFQPLAAGNPSLMSPELPRRLNWCAVERKWLADLQEGLKANPASPALETLPNRGSLQSPPVYDAGPLGHP